MTLVCHTVAKSVELLIITLPLHFILIKYICFRLLSLSHIIPRFQLSIDDATPWQLYGCKQWLTSSKFSCALNPLPPRKYPLWVYRLSLTLTVARVYVSLHELLHSLHTSCAWLCKMYSYLSFAAKLSETQSHYYTAAINIWCAHDSKSLGIKLVLCAAFI